MKRLWLSNRILFWLLPLALVSPGIACGRHGKSAPTGGSDEKPRSIKLARPVDLVRVQQRSIVYHVETIGVLEAEGQTDIAAGVNGVVDEVLFREGDYVTPGTVLVRIDQTRFVAEEESALANHERAASAMELARDLAARVERLGKGISEEEKVRAYSAVRLADAEVRVARANLVRAKNNLDRSRVRAPYAGRINKRMVTKGSYLEEKTVIGTIADLTRIRLVGYVPETAAPLVRELINSQARRLAVTRTIIPLGSLGSAQTPWSVLAGAQLASRDYLISGFDPEFELLAIPNQKFFARIFYMSTVAAADTHMFEAKAEVVGWKPPSVGPTPLQQAAQALTALGQWSSPHLAAGSLASPLLSPTVSPSSPEFELKPGYTAKIRFPMRSSQDAVVIPEEAGKWEAVRASEHGFIAFVPVPERDEQGRIILNKQGRPHWIAQRRLLELGYRAPGWVEVRSGLTPGEWVVRRGADQLEAGTPLNIPEEQLLQMTGEQGVLTPR